MIELLNLHFYTTVGGYICFPDLILLSDKHFSVCQSSGEKKKFRKEMIAEKRRERMLHRGVDLEQINLVMRIS